MMEVSEHLQGPWKAVLVAEDSDDFFTDLADVPAGVEVAVTVLRGQTLAAALSGGIPEDYDLDELDVLYLMEPDDCDDWGRQLPARWVQAQAVAELLNGLPGQSANEPGA